jgi:hypothetical protein
VALTIPHRISAAVPALLALEGTGGRRAQGVGGFPRAADHSEVPTRASAHPRLLVQSVDLAPRAAQTGVHVS